MAFDAFSQARRAIPGESTDDNHKRRDRPDVVQLGSDPRRGNLGKGSGAGAGKVSFQDFHFSMKINKASPGLFRPQCATGKHIPNGLPDGQKRPGERPARVSLKIKLNGRTCLVVPDRAANLLGQTRSTARSKSDGDVPIDQFHAQLPKHQLQLHPRNPRPAGRTRPHRSTRPRKGLRVPPGKGALASRRDPHRGAYALPGLKPRFRVIWVLRPIVPCSRPFPSSAPAGRPSPSGRSPVTTGLGVGRGAVAVLRDTAVCLARRVSAHDAAHRRDAPGAAGAESTFCRAGQGRGAPATPALGDAAAEGVTRRRSPAIRIHATPGTEGRR